MFQSQPHHPRFGLLTTPILIDNKQLLYLKTLLDKPNDYWTREMLLLLKKDGLGWAAQMERVLERYGLERDWEKIKKMEARTWKTAVVETTEKMNKETILQMCQGRNGEKTKT